MSPQQEVELVYPAMKVKEKYAITVPRNPDDFGPVEDIVNTMRVVAENFMPQREADEVLDEGMGCLSQTRRAWKKEQPSAFFKGIEAYNAIITKLKAEGKIEAHLRQTQRLAPDLFDHIINQTYARTVALEVDSLRGYEGRILGDWSGELD